MKYKSDIVLNWRLMSFLLLFLIVGCSENSNNYGAQEISDEEKEGTLLNSKVITSEIKTYKWECSPGIDFYTQKPIKKKAAIIGDKIIIYEKDNTFKIEVINLSDIREGPKKGDKFPVKNVSYKDGVLQYDITFTGFHGGMIATQQIEMTSKDIKFLRGSHFKAKFYLLDGNIRSLIGEVHFASLDK